MKCLSLLFLAATLLLACPRVQARTANVASPDGSIVVSVSDAIHPLPTFSVTMDGDTLLQPSPLSLDIRGNNAASRIVKADVRKGLSERISSPFYRQKEFDVNYNSMVVKLDNGVDIEWRVFDDGVAYRYVTSMKDSIIVDGEVAAYNFAGDPVTYLAYSTNKENPCAMAFQNQFTVAPLSHAQPQLAFLPATIDAGKGRKLTILESDLESYPGMFLTADTISGILNGGFACYPKAFDYYPWRRQRYVTEIEDYIAKTVGTRAFPWRIFALTRKDTEMPVNNLVYALAHPSKLEDTGWIKPGKVAWDWWNDWGLAGVPFEAGINTATYKYYIDFAAKNGIEYVVLDEGWYNPSSGDMLSVIEDIDLPELVRYGKEKGVDLVLWTVFNVLDDQLPQACEKYSKMGIKGFKVDFLDRNDQEAVEMTYRIAKACAEHNLFLDYHGIYTPTGLNRTYPNVLNYEAVFGMEEVKWGDPSTDFPRYDVTYPFIRNMAGQTDFTPGAMRNATQRDWRAIYSHPMSMGTRAHQLASYVINDSPFTMLCDSPSNYEKEQACVGLITSIPTVFDEAKVIDGALGEYIVMARRNGDSWYIGGATNWTPRDLTVSLDMLNPSTKYRAIILSDGPNAHRAAQDYNISIQIVDSSSAKSLHLAPGGGFVMILLPE